MCNTDKELNYNGNDIENINLKEASKEQLTKLADGIVSNKENVQQVKVFPDSWDSLSIQQKEEIAWNLTEEIKEAIAELNDSSEYTPKITKEDADKVAALEYVRENKEKIPQTWIKLEEKANEVARNIWIEIEDKWIIDKSEGRLAA